MSFKFNRLRLVPYGTSNKKEISAALWLETICRVHPELLKTLWR